MEGTENGNIGTRARATALYTFLKEFTELRTKTIRDVEEYEDVLWFSDVPREPECSCAAWLRGNEREVADVWLEVRQPRLVAAPNPSKELGPWLELGQIADSSLEMPELRKEIAVRIHDTTGEDRFERRLLSDNPGIKSLWEKYVEVSWWPWAEADRRAQATQRVYTKLFSIYQKQQRLGEQYEVVLGLGLLSWRTPDNQKVRRHLLAASASVAFDSVRGIMTVGSAGEGAKTHIEQDMLDPTCRPDAQELQALEAQVAEVGDQVWDPTSIDAILAAWVHSASSRGIYRAEMALPREVLADPQVHLTPGLILRKRTERSFVKAFEEIISQLKGLVPIPPGVSQFVTVTEGREIDATLESGRGVTAEELFFPLESNEAQRRIVERLTGHTGVLVQGPPGTGKSHTIVNLICHLLASGQRVLVTSHTARALKVLQRYISEKASEIAPLAVVLLGDDRDALQAMEDSVQGITQRQNHWNADTSERKVRQLESQLDEARREEAEVLSELRAVREQETYVHPVRFGAFAGTLQTIAGRLRKEEETFDWIEDRPGESEDPPLLSGQFQELVSLLRDADINEWQQSGWSAVDVLSLPSPDVFAALVDDELQARLAFDQASTSRHHPEYAPLAKAPDEARKPLHDELGALLALVDRITGHLQPWSRSAVSQILGGHDRIWGELRDVTNEHLSRIASRTRWVDETPVTGLGVRNHHEVRADAEAMIAHLNDGHGWGIWPFRAGPAKRGHYLRREVKISGRPCQTPDALRDLVAWFEVRESLRLLRERWKAYHSVVGGGCSAQASEFADLCRLLESALGLLEHVGRVRTRVNAISGLVEPSWHDLDALRRLRECGVAVEHEKRLQIAGDALAGVGHRISSLAQAPGADPVGKDLLVALDARDLGRYRESFARAVRNKTIASAQARREGLLSQLRESAPLLAEQVATTVRDGMWEARATQFEAAWNWARAIAWLERLCDLDAEQQARIRLDSARERIRSRLKALAAEKAWAHCFERMTEHERQHLVAWSKAVRSIGKGTGKYAPVHRRNAREHLNECRSAIPAWVMPLYRVAETIKPGTDLFDVVIIDEASQSGPEALLLAYLGKKLVVVGDDKQISPTYAGINHEDVNQLRARHLVDLPHADSYGVQQSFFDLAEIRYQGRIRLREHFRCMPEIIQFSNNLCYQSEPLIPLRQYGASRLSPVVSVVPVPTGYLKGSGQSVINPPEAKAIVDALLEMLANPVYKGKTFGVISLLGDAQAREIERLVLERLGPMEIERRQLVCGDAYAFQGDERDVMLLSLVSAPSEERRIGTLTDEASRRRFNVAASRARDQLYLFHTATINDLSPLCLRHVLLKYCQNPNVEPTTVSGISIPDLQHLAYVADRGRLPAPEPFESWFEVDIFLKLSTRGFRVLPQYELADYRIDLVVEGMRGRLAVECDGDRWHGPDRFDEDMTRQRMLERCGLRFCRIRGSAFTLDPDGALDELWETLTREGIYPDGEEPTRDAIVSSRDPERFAELVPEPLPSEVGAQILKQPESADDDGEPEQDVSGSRAKQRDVPALFASSEMNGIADAPYRAWMSESRLPDPAESRPRELVDPLVDIVSAEGPMSEYQLYRVFVKGAGRQRVGRQSRSALNKAVSMALREGRINQLGEGGMGNRTLWRAGAPSVVVRPRGSRDFVEIPASEVATAMLRLERKEPTLRDEMLCRAVLDFYETKRMTSNILQRLKWIHERRKELTQVGGLARDDA